MGLFYVHQGRSKKKKLPETKSLLEARAQHRKFLISKGIDASRLTTLAYGEYMAEGETTTDKASNRRISFKVNRTSF